MSIKATRRIGKLPSAKSSIRIHVAASIRRDELRESLISSPTVRKYWTRVARPSGKRIGQHALPTSPNSHCVAAGLGGLFWRSCRSVAQPGRALGLGPRRRRFKSCRSDHFHSQVLFSMTGRRSANLPGRIRLSPRFGQFFYDILPREHPRAQFPAVFVGVDGFLVAKFKHAVRLIRT